HEPGGEVGVARVGADEVGDPPGHSRRLARAAEFGLVEVDAGHLVAQPRERHGVAAEAARRVQHVRARLEARHADDPAYGATRADFRLQRLRDRRPCLAEEAFALEHADYY